MKSKSEENSTVDIENNISPELFKSSTFIHSVFIISGGVVVAQIIAVIATLIITRIYSPEAFGQAALFLSFTSIIGIVACLMYESSIVLPKSDEEAANLLGLCIFFIIITSFLTIPFFIIGGPYILPVFNATAIQPYFWLIPPAIFFGGIFLALNYWNLRRNHLKTISVARVSNSILTNGTKIGAGFAGYTSGGGLIIAGVIGSIVSTLIIAYKIWKEDWTFIKQSISLNRMIEGLIKYKNFPLYSSWSEIINAFSLQLPILLLAIFFSSTIVGYYSLGLLVLQVPISFLGTAVGQVFFQQAAAAHHDSKKKLIQIIENTSERLFMIGIFPLILLSIMGEQITVLFFGTQWTEAGIYIQILAIWIFLVFITSPLTSLFVIFGQQKMTLLFNIIIIIFRSVAIIAGGLSGDARFTILLLSIVGVISYCIVFIWLMKLSSISYRSICSRFSKYIVYGIFITFLLLLFKYEFSFRPVLLVLIGGFMGLMYYAIVIRDDLVIRSALNEVLIELKTFLKIQ